MLVPTPHYDAVAEKALGTLKLEGAFKPAGTGPFSNQEAVMLLICE